MYTNQNDGNGRDAVETKKELQARKTTAQDKVLGPCLPGTERGQSRK